MQRQRHTVPRVRFLFVRRWDIGSVISLATLTILGRRGHWDHRDPGKAPSQSRDAQDDDREEDDVAAAGPDRCPHGPPPDGCRRL